MKPAARKKVVTVLFILVLSRHCHSIHPSRPGQPACDGRSGGSSGSKSHPAARLLNCHSNQTRLAWFDQPAPAYWLVVKDVRAARKVLNFSDWDSLPKAQQAAKLYEALNQVEFHVMPLSNYAMLHHDAVVTPEEVTVLRQYLLTLAPKAVPDTAKQRIALEQFAQTDKDSYGYSRSKSGL
jgi:hypothetical protein